MKEEWMGEICMDQKRRLLLLEQHLFSQFGSFVTEFFKISKDSCEQATSQQSFKIHLPYLQCEISFYKNSIKTLELYKLNLTWAPCSFSLGDPFPPWICSTDTCSPWTGIWSKLSWSTARRLPESFRLREETSRSSSVSSDREKEKHYCTENGYCFNWSATQELRNKCKVW